jgi:hypothetical protein
MRRIGHEAEGLRSWIVRIERREVCGVRFSRN